MNAALTLFAWRSAAKRLALWASRPPTFDIAATALRYLARAVSSAWQALALTLRGHLGFPAAARAAEISSPSGRREGSGGSCTAARLAAVSCIRWRHIGTQS